MQRGLNASAVQIIMQNEGLQHEAGTSSAAVDHRMLNCSLTQMNCPVTEVTQPHTQSLQKQLVTVKRAVFLCSANFSQSLIALMALPFLQEKSDFGWHAQC